MEVKFQRPKPSRPQDNLRLEGERYCFSSRYDREYGIVGFRRMDNHDKTSNSPCCSQPTLSPYSQTTATTIKNEEDAVSTSTFGETVSLMSDESIAFPIDDQQDENTIEENISIQHEPSETFEFIELGSSNIRGTPVSEYTISPLSVSTEADQKSPLNIVARRIVEDDNCVYGPDRKTKQKKARYPKRPKKIRPKSNLALPTPDQETLADWKRPTLPNFWENQEDGDSSDDEYKFDGKDGGIGMGEVSESKDLPDISNEGESAAGQQPEDINEIGNDHCEEVTEEIDEPEGEVLQDEEQVENLPDNSHEGESAAGQQPEDINEIGNDHCEEVTEEIDEPEGEVLQDEEQVENCPEEIPSEDQSDEIPCGEEPEANDVSTEEIANESELPGGENQQDAAPHESTGQSGQLEMEQDPLVKQIVTQWQALRIHC